MAAVVGQDRYVFSSRVRIAAPLFVAASVGLALVLGVDAHGQREYLTAWAVVSAVPLLPSLIVAPRALRHVARGERVVWQLWTAGWAVVYGGALLVYLIGVQGWDWLSGVPLPASLAGGLAFGLGNTMALRKRAGQRAPQVDLLDLATSVVAVAGPLGLVFADRVLAADHAWLTLPAALVVVGLVHGCVTLVLICLRVAPERRGIVLLGFVFVFVALLDAAAQVAQGVTDFGLPAAPLIGLHALVMGGSFLMGVYALRHTSRGLLDDMPPQQQVRKNGILAVVVLTTMTATGVIAVVRRDEAWVVVAAVLLIMLLLVLTMIRQLFLARETVRLYGEVERAADERRELLAEVMRSVDTDHHRAAVHLHKQAASLYTAMASFARALDWLPGQELPASVGLAAERVRFDLARRVDASQQILTAIEPGPAAQDGLVRLVALTRAYVGNLWGDARQPDLFVDVDDRLVVDWTHEVVVFRIVQMAVHNIWRHADADHIGVSIAAPDDTLTVRVDDDGAGFDPATVEVGAGITTVQTLAAYLDGHVDIDSTPGNGTRVSAVLGAAQPRPRLRVVT
jgi:two-component system, NarL family, sensor histidine kinase UhpB